jgi:hypothetical protein
MQKEIIMKECKTCLGHGRIEDGEDGHLRKCLDCNGTGKVSGTRRATRKSEFKRVNRDGQYRYVKEVAGGGEVHRSKYEFAAYDKDGHYLGFCADQDKAEAMAFSGSPNDMTLDVANELSLWVMWNDAVNGGARVMSDDDGYQIMALPNGVFMRAKDDGKEYETELLSDVEMEEQYWDEANQSYHLHVVAEGKLVLE